MRKALLATTAFAFAGAMGAGSASAADMLSIGLGGYMEQWVGYANRDDKGADGGFDVQSDTEIYFQGSLEADNGLKFTVHVQLEGNNSTATAVDADGKDVTTADTEIDESYLRVSGEFGDMEIGQRDPVHARMHYATGDAGIGLNAGDSQKWIPGSYLETAGWLGSVAGDALGVSYITPRINGLQVGLSYHPDSTNENKPTGAPAGNDDAVVAAGINYNETIGDMSFKISLGHLSRSQSGMAEFDLDKDNSLMTHTEAQRSMDDMVKGYDNATYTNAGLSVGMGAFTFSASYATRDGGDYMSKCYLLDTAAALPEGTATATMAAPPAVQPGEMVACDDSRVFFEGQNQTALAGDGTEQDITETVNARHMFVENEAGQHDTWGVGIMYTDGPLSVSIGHMVREQEDGVERVATMMSGGYKLAPGVDWKTSVFTVDDEGKTGGEGTAFVTGLDIHF